MRVVLFDVFIDIVLLQVLSFTQLFRDFKDQSMFIACGYEPLKRTSNLGRQRDETDDLNASADRIVMDDIIDDYPKPSQRGPSMAKVGRYAMMYQDWKRFKDKRWKKEEETVQPGKHEKGVILSFFVSIVTHSLVSLSLIQR